MGRAEAVTPLRRVWLVPGQTAPVQRASHAMTETARAGARAPVAVSPRWMVAGVGGCAETAAARLAPARTRMDGCRFA
ncbi:phosphoribosylaminoimidazole-succinocarboxamide synthase [Leifsonia xyli subsp. cynodontis DSM 46306]|uniref:Uncharacterized protein n=1 Tax=Leifsonia xyli subsp. cynodontis DSM 46306 TaxID=1389489 RepID=U3PAF9_LEIXC|nr:phosphoribosylaminoimidazole-succinocarboxamide synthase [Leifsonia xyli subsp. cynodontis DSM 46306]